MTGNERTPMVVIGGSLGSGKTTLLRRLLRGEHGKLAVMVNEFGEIGIDGRVVAGRDIDLIELSGGCVCCSLSGEFEAGVRELLGRARPQAVIVETTGVAEADALIDNIGDSLPEVRLEAVVVLIDADAAGRFPELGYVERRQLESADLILVNKVDLCTRRQIDELRTRLENLHPRGRIVETVQADIDPQLLLARAATRPVSAHSPGHRVAEARDSHHRSHGMQTFSWRPPRGLSRRAFEDAVAAWPREVFRAKGSVRLDGQPMLFNYVAGRFQLEPQEQAAPPALVWIGPRIERHRDSIIASMETCLE